MISRGLFVVMRRNIGILSDENLNLCLEDTSLFIGKKIFDPISYCWILYRGLRVIYKFLHVSSFVENLECSFITFKVFSRKFIFL